MEVCGNQSREPPWHQSFNVWPCLRNTSHVYKLKQTLGHHDLLQLLQTLHRRHLLPGVLTIHMVHLLLQTGKPQWQDNALHQSHSS